ncbi:MAG TPA: TIGR03960 family B12-binding radical SAM protein [Planctomycetota bacterium]|jgi:radical SAM family uncharacterized protein/radical SAM-linked protein|nr:TIGR03960 family B12-binding radical SAM protein [Planctomycetota bacterium]OQC19486.1 MAG: Radical SAM superfamily protein [Planctomycetes bacterium ADurb.Bin069]HNS00470.1 TIGR03960 family B12-binding radical SAM protein [Planctomycetota bacterium]HNU25307.1 TIGR03960 family B12-binding radical SAM protein [Planctomycetota bacterium]HOE31404.1 TIGR03960 family B12-binding radical SAM protein [Planctomycetota bacterium]
MEHPYADFLLSVEKPSRYVGGEYGSAPDTDGMPVALAFPDTYEIGMCFLGFHILYDVLRREPGIRVERVFAAWPDLEAELRARKLPLVSLESWRPLRDFAVVGFSLQYELSFTNVLAMLELGRIPLRSADRGPDDPIVIAGGPVAFQPEPLAPFLDAIVLGDGEEALPALLRTVKELRAEGASRRALLDALGALPGVYVPAATTVAEDPATGFLVPRHAGLVRRAPPVDLAAHPFPTALPIPDTEIVFDRYAIEIARGCNGGCRFCQGGFIYRPLRMRSHGEVARAVRKGLAASGFEAASLTALSTADYPGIERLAGTLAEELAANWTELSISSLRAYALPDALFEALGRIRQSTLTFALEAGTQRLRDAINKNIRQEDILTSVERAARSGWRRIKLYFMIGLPTETDADVRAIIDATRTIRDAVARFGKNAAAGVTASVSTFVPKAHTPFQWEPMIGRDEIKRRQRLLYDLAKRHRISLKWHGAEMSLVEGVMARGDRRVAEAVLKAYEGGCRFDGWADRFDFAKWEAAFAAAGIDVERYLAALPVGCRLPWDHIGTGVDAEFLIREHGRARAGEASAPCYFERVCHACGAECDFEAAAVVTDEIAAKAAAPVPEKEFAPWRVTFRRGGRMRYVSQLDLVRTFPRVFRRAGIALGYSRGFRPKPLVSFSPALPLGAVALRDLADVRLRAGGLTGPELAARLTAVAPEGLEFLQARELREWEKKLSRRIDAVDSAAALGPGRPRAAIEEAVARFMDADKVELVVPTKHGYDKRVDIRAWVEEARVCDGVEGAGPAEGPFLFLRAKPEIRIATIIAHLAGEEIPGTRIYRVDLVARGALGFASIR